MHAAADLLIDRRSDQLVQLAVHRFQLGRDGRRHERGEIQAGHSVQFDDRVGVLSGLTGFSTRCAHFVRTRGSAFSSL
jgi:hypothetical protein